MKLFIKYMVSNRCKLAVKEELKKLQVHFIVVALGEVEIMEDISSEQREQLKNGLLASGLELIDDTKAVLIEKIKAVIIQMVHHSDEIIKSNFSDFLSEKLDYDYTYLANLFSEVQGTTIEQFIISHKIERIKELIIYGELNISEIAWKLNYSSVSHLSNQFKKVTGLSPTHFKQLKDKRRSPIEEIGNVNDIHQNETIIPESYSASVLESTDNKEHRYTRSLMEASLDPFVTISAEGKITDVNLALVKVTGLPSEQLINTDFSDYFTEPKKAQEVYQQVFEKGFVADYLLTIKHKNGHLTDVSYNASVYKDDDGNVLGVFAAARDITETKKLESERSALASIVESSHNAVIGNTLGGIITSWNKACEKIYGYTAEEVIGKNISIIAPKDRKNDIPSLLERVAKGEKIDQYETVRKRKDGTHVPISLAVSPIKDIEGKIIGTSSIERDITELKKIEEKADKAEAEIKRASAYSRSLIEASLDPLVMISPKGEITDVNKALIKVIGISREQLINTDFSDYFTEPKKAQEVYQQVFEKGFVADYPLTIKHKNGHLTDVSYNASVYKDDSGNVLGVFAAARDVTEQKWAIELRKANKELAFQNDEKEKRAAELVIANKELAYQNDEKGKRSEELSIANKELAFQSNEKGKRSDELIIANKELAYQNDEKEKRAAELVIANQELAFQMDAKGKQSEELRVAYEELIFQNEESEKRAVELVLSDQELTFQTQETEKEKTANIELEAISETLKLASQYSLSLIEASLDPLITISNKGKITDMNEALVNITGISRIALTGTDFFEYFTEPQKAREVYQEVFAKGFVVDSPLILRHKNGKLTDVLFNGSVYKNDKGDVLGVVIVARDVTEQKRISTELTEAIVFAEMATLIAEEAKSKAESATLTAENAVKAKQLFLSNMSHEIRTPMNAIIGFTKVMLKTSLSDKQSEYLNAIKLSGDALIVLINDILDLAKVDAGQMKFEQIPFKMALSLQAMLHLFEPKIQEKNLKLIKNYDKKIPQVLIGDPVRLHQIILNLVSNAVKFTVKGEITVSVSLIDEDEKTATIEFEIKDTGIGIKENKIDKIFENFQQASSGTSRLYGGTGLGLAIVKQLVESQNGTVRVKSKTNEGSSFSFVLSFYKTKSVLEPETDAFDLDEELTDIKVLVVEDIALNQLLMRTLLDDFGFECDIAANGKIAIDKMQSNTYNVILMDLQMPEMNGFEATDYIRNTLNSNIPIIALTADVTTADLTKCKAVGMNDYIAKPVDERLLYDKMIGLIKNSSQITDPNVDIIKTSATSRCTNLDYLRQRTKSNPILMMEMISLYLE
ncbi:MAG: PAS domain S-box protein [Salinivirgaceae bacterium]|nr:PAS domain S-box protein [Salinivirgaceae bacterium]